MRVEPYQDPELFCRDVFPFLLPHEANNQLLLGLLGGLRQDGWLRLYSQPPVMGAVRDSRGSIVCVTLRTPPHVILVSEGSDEAIDLLASWHAEKNIDAPGVMGSTQQACRFAAEWSRVTGRSHRKRIELIAHELIAVSPCQVSGHMRTGELADRDVLIEWTSGFIQETGICHAAPAAQSVDFRLKRNDIVVWVDGGEPRAMLQIGGETPNGKRIGGVYTPSHYRRRGYASALVAGASQKVLDSGKSRSFLFTDAANPTSNHIYRQIGYRPVCELTEFEFRAFPIKL